MDSVSENVLDNAKIPVMVIKMNYMQVEVSTKCQLNCLMCPKAIFKDWIAKNMDMDLFKLLPFKKFRYVHLQGWGEPLMNENIPEMIDIARKYCKVGLTTNGLRINEFLRDLRKLDLVAVSIAAADNEKHKKIRKCSLDDVIENVRLLSEIRKEEGKPKIVIATMLLKDTYNDLPKIVEIAKRCGADEVIANNMDYIPSKELEDQAIFLQDVDDKPIKTSKDLAKKLGIRFIAKQTKLEELLVCPENPIENCLITYDGKVAPCVYLHLPTKSDKIRRVFKGDVIEIKKLYFGNVVSGFENVWNSFEYVRFRQVFEKRVNIAFTFPPKIPDLPECCKSCYKAYSI